MTSSVELCRVGSLIYPIMLTQEAGRISEQKAAELLGLSLQSYRETKYQATEAIMRMVESLPSPLILLLDGMKDRPESSTHLDGA